ncbi:MAG: nucleoside-diphosphate-sugar pyrophosphorylase [Deltaproteobacteria bacterium RBG_16_50_11]|nr:MAG: nucleoside-diphosphate-sugar pyrophosphorylase [Deltaproteobacteria bacterium RBG_16_50_11]
MKAIILAGGKGTRLAPYTTVFPKPLMPVDGVPILEVIIRQLAHFRIKEMVLTVSPQSEPLLSAYFGDGKRYGVDMTYSREETPLGTAGPLSLLSGLPETFLVMNGDILTTLNYQKLIQFHRRRGGLVTIAMSQKKVPLELVIMEFDRTHQLTRYIEKPTLSYSVSMGIYIFERKVLKWISPGKYLDFPELIQKLLQRKERVICYPSEDFWLDIGRHEDYEEAQKQFQKLRKKLLYEK